MVFSITDDLGRVHGPRIEYRQVAENVASFLAAQVTTLALALRDGEIARNVRQVVTLGEEASPTLEYSTAAQNFVALREAYADATRFQAVMIGDFLNTLTDGQLQTAFGITAGQVTTLRTNKLGPAAALADQIRASTGQ